jgi:pentose-5-phosphate-3-epimerase
VDGGVDLETVADVVKGGAESLVAGNAAFGRGCIRGHAAKLLNVASSSDVN